jgi:hypothetical protein
MIDCEKGNIREHCDYVGFERSVYLATLFGHGSERWPAPSFIFAQGPGNRHTRNKLNFRELETIGPLSKKLGVSVDYSYNDDTINDLALEILSYLQSGAMCGKVALVVWKHSRIGHLAHRLGCGPAQGCPVDYPGRSFDESWQLKFAYHVNEYSSTKSLKHPEKPQWRVYGSVQPEAFDPLAFSKLVGDYVSVKSHDKQRRRHDNDDHHTHRDSMESSLLEAHWEQSTVKIPERRKPTDRSEWEALKLGMWPGQLLGSTNRNNETD